MKNTQELVHALYVLDLIKDLRRRKIGFSRADMCLNCSLSVKSMKFGMMVVFKALKKIGYGAIAEKSVKCEK